MAKKEVSVVDYSKLTLPEIIKRKTKRKCSFFELEQEDKRGVLDYIQSHQIDIKIYGLRWFDVLSKKFYVEEYIASDDYFYGVDKEIHSFDTFEDFYIFLGCDIYNNSCFYGYQFSKDEIEKYSLELDKINFDSFIVETIDEHSFEALNEISNADNELKVSRSKEMIKWLKKCKTINTCDELAKKRNQFTSKFDFWDAKYIFFSYLLRTQRDTIKDALIEFVCQKEYYLGLTFDDILINYGRDAAIEVIQNYYGSCSYATTRKRIRNFKDSLAGYDSGTFQRDRKITFDETSQMYVVKDLFFNRVNMSLRIKRYFESLEELSTFVSKDFRGADFSKAPITENDLAGCQIDDNTKFPLDKNYSKYIVKKYFSDDKFHVAQIWLDSKDREIESKKQSFERFFDFVHFLKNDISDSDLLMCNGIENIEGLKDLKIQNIKVRSYVSSLLKLPLREIPKDRFVVKDFSESTKLELQTVESFELQRADDDDYSDRVSYITDIHLLHRFEAYKCQTFDDTNYTIRLLAQSIGEQSTSVNLIAGDISSDFETFKIFGNNLSKASRGRTFYVLGNHELWDSSFCGMTLEEVVQKYREYSNSKASGMDLVHNNLYYLTDSCWESLSTEALNDITSDELRNKMRGSRLIIFGGMGFAGKNEEFNANAGLYLSIVNREQEIKESEKFLELYEKVTESLKGMNLIVLTHMPMRDWGGDIHAKEGVVYVNGHSHRNYFYDDGKKRIYADNQIGYKGKRVNYKTISIDFGYNWFADYKDGIYEITKNDYERFYRGISEELTFNREFANLYMIKREGAYMFLMRTPNGSLQILNGGSIRKAGNHELEYFYENLTKYSKSVSMFLSKYDAFQKQISSEVKRIGGYGHIHGSIVDIDFYNHLYLNPLDGSVTPYFAYSMVEKYVYNNVPSLLKYECPQLFANYEKLITDNSTSTSLALYNQQLPVIKKRTYVDSTEMYMISRILKCLQFTTKYNIVRLWNDNFVAESSEENGRLIVSGIIDSDSVPQVVEVKKTPIISKPKAIPQKKIILSAEERAKKKLEDYKARISQETSTIEVVEYINSTSKAKYKCNCCGYEWSTRPDHFKDRQNYTCPKCKK